MSDLQTFMERNQTFASQYDGGLSIMPTFSTLVLTCADARIDPAHFLGLDLGGCPRLSQRGRTGDGRSGMD